MKTKDIQIGAEYALGSPNSDFPARRVRVLGVGAKRTTMSERFIRSTTNNGIRVQHLDSGWGAWQGLREEVALPQQILHPWEEEVRLQALKDERRAKTQQAEVSIKNRFHTARERLNALVPDLGFQDYNSTGWGLSLNAKLSVSQLEKLVQALEAK